MKIRAVESRNNTNFGVNYINKAKWNKELLNTLEKSELVKKIDEKYPDAFMKYSKHNETGLDLGNDEPDFLASLIIGLNKDKITAYNINSHTSEGADRALNKYIANVSLADVEKRASETAETPNYSVKITAKKQNPILKIISKLLG